MDATQFEVIVLGIIFDTKTQKVLIGKRKDPKDFNGLTWAFPGGRPEVGEELETSVKREVKEETNIDIESLGVIFAKTYPEKRDLISIYFLCEVIEGEEKANEDFSEMKWVSLNEIKDYFTTSYHPKLKEYLEGLVHSKQ